jgi:hypothetical protein
MQWAMGKGQCARGKGQWAINTNYEMTPHLAPTGNNRHGYAKKYCC